MIHAFRMPAFYSIAGFFGALLWNRRGAPSFFRNRGKRILLPRFEKHLIPYLVAAVPAFFVYGLARNPLMKAAGNVLLCWLLTFATTGLFLRYCSRPSARWRYMSDSSYWLYIMHMPVVVGLQVAFLPVPLPALAKVPLVLAVAVVLLVATYDLLVRPTWIGAMLNGRRYERGLPVSGPATELLPVGQVTIQ